MGAPRDWAESVAKPYRGRRCLRWPFATYTNGYGQLTPVGGKKARPAHRVILCELTGVDPADRVAAHTCGKGHLGCVNPRHLRWATMKENMADRLVHGTSNRGTRHGNCVLEEAEVLQIYADPRGNRDIAEAYGIGTATVWNIKRGNSWGWLTGGVR